MTKSSTSGSQTATSAVRGGKALSAMSLAACLLCFGIAGQTQDVRSDSFDITHINLNMDLSDIPGKLLIGHAQLSISPKIDQPSVLPLDLLELQVDSVLIDGSISSYSYNDTLLEIPLAALAASDTFLVEVFYQGTPVTDPSGFGGFYFSGAHAFNIGVGFFADPHNYGRVWYPCFDNFIEKSPYTMSVVTTDSDMAVCSGSLDSSSAQGPGKTIWHYSMEEPIPSYLSSVAVAPFEIIEWLYNGQSAAVPVRIAAADTSNVSSSFVNLLGAMEAFENSYGPVQFDRVGYCILPFNGGAMEHPTNIAYGTFAMTGNTQWEGLMAHELAHHWWGDQVTCETAEDMWINEGWASYSENIFEEHVYGPEAYKEAVRANHRQVVQFTHARDAGYRAVSGVPHAHTYGSTVYDKGADVAHTLRGYLGDDTFFDCIARFLADSGFASVSSAEFRDYLTGCSGMDMTDFFDDWVFNPGFPHFSIDSIKSIGDGFGYSVSVYVRQRLNNAPDYFENVPIDITFMGEQFQTKTEQLVMTGRCGVYHAWMNFDPVFVALDMEERISDAISDEYRVFTSQGSHDFADALLDVDVNSVAGDSILVRVEHNFVPPDRMNSAIPGLILSDYRYWKVSGIAPGPLDARATIRYNGTTSMSAGWLDIGLITNSEDSIVLMYRKDPGHEWIEHPNYTLNVQGSSSNKIGRIEVHELRFGEYTLAIWDHGRTDTVQSDIPPECADLNVGGVQGSEQPTLLKMQPNPADDRVQFILLEPGARYDFKMLDSSGRAVLQDRLTAGVAKTVDTSSLPQGVYLVELWSDGEAIAVEKLVIAR